MDHWGKGGYPQKRKHYYKQLIFKMDIEDLHKTQKTAAWLYILVPSLEDRSEADRTSDSKHFIGQGKGPKNIQNKTKTPLNYRLYYLNCLLAQTPV